MYDFRNLGSMGRMCGVLLKAVQVDYLVPECEEYASSSVNVVLSTFGEPTLTLNPEHKGLISSIVQHQNTYESDSFMASYQVKQKIE